MVFSNLPAFVDVETYHEQKLLCNADMDSLPTFDGFGRIPVDHRSLVDGLECCMGVRERCNQR